MDQTTNDDGYNILDEAVHILAGLEFEASQPVPSVQGVREFLSVVAGPGWMHAQVLTHSVPGGAQVHMASLPGSFPKPGFAVLVVVEALDGSLSLSHPTTIDPPRVLGPLVFFAAEQAPTQEQQVIYSELLECVRKINRAMKSIAKIVKLCGTVKPLRKSYLLDQIAHANQHLTDYVDGFRPQGE